MKQGLRKPSGIGTNVLKQCETINFHLPHLPTLLIHKTSPVLLAAADDNKNNQCPHKYSSKNAYCHSDYSFHSFHCNGSRRKCLRRCDIADHENNTIHSRTLRNWCFTWVMCSTVFITFFIPLCRWRIKHLETSNGNFFQNSWPFL